MKSKILLIVPLILSTLSIVASVRGAPAWYAELQLEITDFIFVGVDEQGIHFDVPFVGAAGGPGIKEGTAVGVDHLLIDSEGNVNLNVYLTITDKDGDKISVSKTGFSVVGNSPSQRTFEGGEATIIDEPGYPTTGKYVGLVGTRFRSEGFISDFSRDPPSGFIHVKLYWP